MKMIVTKSLAVLHYTEHDCTIFLGSNDLPLRLSEPDRYTYDHTQCTTTDSEGSSNSGMVASCSAHIQV